MGLRRFWIGIADHEIKVALRIANLFFERLLMNGLYCCF